jgi:protein involved in polysaccharide export with SLBB domain
MENAAKNLGDYLNLRNSLLNPAEVGRFDKDNPWGTVRPATWPILGQLDVIDAPADEWAAATDPTAADLTADSREIPIGPGDVVRISIYDLRAAGEEWARELAVSENGTVEIPYLGSVRIAGISPAQANEKIGQVAVERGVILPRGNGSPGPQVSVNLIQSRGRVFSIIGVVNRPGTYNILSSNFRVLDALALAGDLPMQPGLDYLYVIRNSQNENLRTLPPEGTTPAGSGATTPPAGSGNPGSILDDITRSTTAPATTPAPTTTPDGATLPPPTPPAPTPPPAPMGPGSTGPTFVRPLPKVISAATLNGTNLAQADLDAAISGNPTTTAPSTTPATPKAPPAGSDDLLNKGIESSGNAGQSVFIDGKWVTIPPVKTPSAVPPGGIPPAIPDTTTVTTPPAPIPALINPTPGPDAYAAAERLSGQRVIRIPIGALRSGDPRYNVIIRPGDIINIPPVETGEFYMLGHVNRTGVYALTGRKITLKMAVAAAGGLDPLAIPRRCDLIRRIGTNQEAIVQVNLQAIFDGTQPDIFLKPNDLVNVGSDMIAPFLAVMRNAYRFSYGFGFVYDRNFYIQPQGRVEGSE